MIHKNMVENGHFLNIQFLQSPNTCCKYFLLKVKKLLFPPPSDRQVNSAGEVMEHGLSRTIQSCAMRRKGVTTPVNRKYRLYPYTVQKLLIFTDLTLDHSITVLHSNLRVWGRLWREACPAASWLTTHFISHVFLLRTATWYICALTDYVSLFRGDTKCLAAPAPITRPASCPPHLCILFTLGACTRTHKNAQQLPEILKSYRFFTQCWIMYSELKKTLHSLQQD